LADDSGPKGSRHSQVHSAAVDLFLSVILIC